MGSDEDWFTRVRGLKPGEPANFVYARDFDANEVELLELPDLLEKIQSGEESLSFKGAPDDEAVLCTSDRTFLVKRVETSNTLLVMQPAGGIDRTVVGDAEGEDDRELDPAADGPTPNDAARDSAAGEHPHRRERHHPRRHLRPPPPRTTPPRSQTSPRTPRLPPTSSSSPEPKLDAMWLALRSPPHAYAGADVDRDADAAWAASLDDTEFGEEGIPDPPPRGFTLDELGRSARPGPGFNPRSTRVPRSGAKMADGEASTRNTSNTPWTSRWSPRRGTDGNWAPSRETPSRTR